MAHALAYKLHGVFHIGAFVESSLALVMAHAGGNLANSYFDYVYGLDKPSTSADRSLFDFGVSPKEVWFYFIICIFIIISLTKSLAKKNRHFC